MESTFYKFPRELVLSALLYFCIPFSAAGLIMDTTEISKDNIVSTPQDEEETWDDEFQELVQTLPKERNWYGAHLYFYQGFWCQSGALKAVISFQKHFQALDSDIIVISFPKCGTTWLKALTFSIVNRNQFAREENPLLILGPHQLVRFIEYDLYLNPSSDLENSSLYQPRLFSTHIPYASLPSSIKDSKSKIVYICRNPMDMFISLWFFTNKLRIENEEPLSLDKAFDLLIFECFDDFRFCTYAIPLGFDPLPVTRISILKLPKPHGRDEIDIAFQIQCLEKEAYSSVLRAFIAQSDLLSWEKEGLMTKLRGELNVTDTEHGELLLKINSDESIKMIREWQKGAPYVQVSLVGELNASGSAPNPMDHALRKKRKTSHSSDSIFHKQEPHGQASPVVLPFPIPAPSDDKGRGIVKSETKIGYNALKKGPDVIEIRETKKLLHEIERVIYGREGIVPAQVEKAKLILKDHERSLLRALAKLSDVSDDDDYPDQMLHHYSHGGVHENKRQIMMHSDYHGQAGGSLIYPPKRYPRKKGYPLKSNDPAYLVKLKVPRP
ncbi:hypothetical protein CRYUN_Cryun05aG0044800 [Craigia yunnanensis]